jgi:hypothetical protein
VFPDEHAIGEMPNENGGCNDDFRLTYYNATARINPLCCPESLFKLDFAWEVRVVKTCGNRCYITGTISKFWFLYK